LPLRLPRRSVRRTSTVPIPFYGELGSVNPCVVLPGAASSRPAAIATGYAGSLTLGAGWASAVHRR
jgi:hypothetical protein